MPWGELVSAVEAYASGRLARGASKDAVRRLLDISQPYTSSFFPGEARGEALLATMRAYEAMQGGGALLDGALAPAQFRAFLTAGDPIEVTRLARYVRRALPAPLLPPPTTHVALLPLAESLLRASGATTLAAPLSVDGSQRVSDVCARHSSPLGVPLRIYASLPTQVEYEGYGTECPLFLEALAAGGGALYAAWPARLSLEFRVDAKSAKNEHLHLLVRPSMQAGAVVRHLARKYSVAQPTATITDSRLALYDASSTVRSADMAQPLVFRGATFMELLMDGQDGGPAAGAPPVDPRMWDDVEARISTGMAKDARTAAGVSQLDDILGDPGLDDALAWLDDV